MGKSKSFEWVNQPLQLPQRDERWHVVVSTPPQQKDAKDGLEICSRCALVAIKRGKKEHKKPKVVGTAEIKGEEPSAEHICKFLVKTMLQPNDKDQVQGKPVKISFEDEKLFKDVAKLLQKDGYHFSASTSTGLIFRGKEAAQTFTDSSLFEHMSQLKKKMEVQLGEGSQLTGVTLKYVQKKGGVTTTSKAAFKFGTPTKKRSWAETCLYAFLFALVALGVGTAFIPGRSLGEWPLSLEKNIMIGDLLSQLQEERFALAMTKITDAVSYHDGFKALSMHFVGNVDGVGNWTVKQLSKALFGNEESDRVLYIQPASELILRTEVFEQLSKWPLSIIVMDSNTIDPTSIHFLTPMLDGTWPKLTANGETISTNQAIFILMSRMMEEELAFLHKSGDLDYLEKDVKQAMKKKGWAARILQRIDHVIPFFP
jgi:hypothetical protein